VTDIYIKRHFVQRLLSEHTQAHTHTHTHTYTHIHTPGRLLYLDH